LDFTAIVLPLAGEFKQPRRDAPRCKACLKIVEKGEKHCDKCKRAEKTQDFTDVYIDPYAVTRLHQMSFELR